MATKTQFWPSFHAVFLLVELSPRPNFLALLTVVADVLIVQVKSLLEHQLFVVVYKLNQHGLVGVLDVEDDGLVPNRRSADP